MSNLNKRDFYRVKQAVKLLFSLDISVCACPPPPADVQAIQSSITEKLDSVQKQIDLLRIDLENLSGNSKSAALYREIMKDSVVNKV